MQKRKQAIYGISTLLVLPRDAAREPRRQQRGHGLGRLDRERERGVPVGILADALVFVAGVYEEFLESPVPRCGGPIVSTVFRAHHTRTHTHTLSLSLSFEQRDARERGENVGLCIRTDSTHGYVQEAQLRGEVERGVALVCEVWVLQVLGVVLDDAFEEGEVLKTDGSADADGDVNPLGFLVRVGFWEVEMADSHSR